VTLTKVRARFSIKTLAGETIAAVTALTLLRTLFVPRVSICWRGGAFFKDLAPTPHNSQLGGGGLEMPKAGMQNHPPSPQKPRDENFSRKIWVEVGWGELWFMMNAGGVKSYHP